MKLVKFTTFKDKFFGNAEFDFDDEHINTISGKMDRERLLYLN